MNKPDFIAELAKRSHIVEEALLKYFTPDAYPDTLYQAMKYSLSAGGKRLRPVLIMAAAEAVGGEPQKAISAACAMEMIHTYSLIHDDLPAMDNDDFRRGKPTNHKIYGEAMAILAGDALLTLAFRILAQAGREAELEAGIMLKIIAEIAEAAGATGMIGGQVVDLESENKAISGETLKYIHTHKTGALIRVSLRCGAIIGGADEEQLHALTRYAEYLGLAFQITDDILDLLGDSEKLGKQTGSDLKKKKATYPSIFGLEESKAMASEAVAKAVKHLEIFGEEADFLKSVAMYLLERDR